MVCPKCGSNNVVVSTEQTSAKTKKKGTGLLRKLGRLTLIIFTGGLWLLIPKKKGYAKTKFKNDTVCICQNCAHKWKA